jgi:F-type H+-transporting ATPase subunit delta
MPMGHVTTEHADGTPEHSGFDISTQHVAKVYARAIVEAADAAGCRREVIDELTMLAREVLPRVPHATAVFASPKVSSDEKQAIINRLAAGRLRPTTTHSLHVLARHGRLGLMQSVATAAARLADELDGIHEAIFTTSVPLNPAGQQLVAGEVQRALAITLRPSFVVDPSIVGGLVVRIGDTIYDQSVATSLARLGDRLRRRNISALQTGEYSWQT